MFPSMPVPCGKFLIGKCLLPPKKCKFSHNKDDSPLCAAWIRAQCSGRCPKRHYYLDKDPKESSSGNKLKGEAHSQKEELIGVKVTNEVKIREVSTVDLDTGVETTKIEETEYQIVDLTEVHSPTNQSQRHDNRTETEQSNSETSSDSSSEYSTDSEDEEGLDNDSKHNDLREVLAFKRKRELKMKAIKIGVDNMDNTKMNVDLQALQLAQSILDNTEEFHSLIEKIQTLPFKNEANL